VGINAAGVFADQMPFLLPTTVSIQGTGFILA